MDRGNFIKFFVPGIWALQSCMKDDVSETNGNMNIVSVQFPQNADFFIAGVLNPVRFTSTISEEVIIKLFDIGRTQLITEQKGRNEVWLPIPTVLNDTQFLLEINKQEFTIEVKNVSGKAVSIKQNEVQFSQGKTIAILDTNDIPFAVKRIAADSYVALDITCTHNGCPTDLQDNNTFSCSCHGSTFDTNGKVTNGPALEALRRFSVQFFPIHQALVVNNK